MNDRDFNKLHEVMLNIASSFKHLTDFMDDNYKNYINCYFKQFDSQYSNRLNITEDSRPVGCDDPLIFNDTFEYTDMDELIITLSHDLERIKRECSNAEILLKNMKK